MPLGEYSPKYTFALWGFAYQDNFFCGPNLRKNVFYFNCWNLKFDMQLLHSVDGRNPRESCTTVSFMKQSIVGHSRAAQTGIRNRAKPMFVEYHRRQFIRDIKTAWHCRNCHLFTARSYSSACPVWHSSLPTCVMKLQVTPTLSYQELSCL